MFSGKDLVLTLTREEVGGYEKGRIGEEFIKKHVDTFSGNFYVCGPKVMVGELKETLSSLGASIEYVVFEK